MQEEKTFDGVRLLYHTGGENKPDDVSYPYKLYVNLRPPEFMDFTFIMLHGGSEEIIAVAKTEKELKEFAEYNNLYNHPRLREIKITKRG